MPLHLAALAVTAPPYFGLPGLFDAFLGYLVGALLLAAPSAYLAWRSHTILGHWTRHFAQWQRRSWWAVSGGSFLLAGGAFLWLGALPAWQTRWQSWSAAALTASPTTTSEIDWLNHTQADLAQLLHVSALVAVVAGVILVALGMWRMSRRVLIRRQPAIPTSDWMFSPADMRPDF